MHAVPVERVTPVLRWHAQRRHMAWLTPTTESRRCYWVAGERDHDVGEKSFG